MSEFVINDIYLKLQEIAKEHSIKLTYADMCIYIQLIEYAKENNEIAVDYPNEVRFSATVQNLSKYCSTSANKITNTLNKLKDCGVIKYATKAPFPSTITLLQQYYE